VSVRRVHQHAEEDRADACEGPDLGRGRRERIDLEDVEVGEMEADAVRPVPAEPIAPLSGGVVEADDEPDLGLGDAFEVRPRRRQAAGEEPARKAARRDDAVAAARGRARAAVTEDALPTVVVRLPD
jgi:hypothetical protein